jgi:hypothetical protein
VESEWAVIANIKPEAYGKATTPGTKHFVAGTKVWAVDWYWGMGGEAVRVLGRHRGSHHLILLTMENERLTNWRAKVAYHPHVVAMLREHRAVRTQLQCEELATGWTKQLGSVPDLRGEIAQLDAALRSIRDEPRGRILAEAAIAVLDETEPSGRTDLFVLADWLEDRGVALPFEKLCKTLKRRRDNAE